MDGHDVGMSTCPTIETERLTMRAFSHDDLDAYFDLFSCILPENSRSQAVAKRLGFSLLEERVLSHFPQMPHGIWFLDA